MTEVESIISDNDITISTTDRGIIINGSDNNIVEVYNVSGQCVYSGTVSIIPLTTNGVYIVKVNNKSFKVIL